jgi:hypothetical protein
MSEEHKMNFKKYENKNWGIKEYSCCSLAASSTTNIVCLQMLILEMHFIFLRVMSTKIIGIVLGNFISEPGTQENLKIYGIILGGFEAFQ